MVALAKIANKLFVINKRKGGLYFIVLNDDKCFIYS